jgi:glycerol-3-phosphate dehydrogenase (NAD(P)+)
VATCTSPQSRNRHVGERLGRGEALEDITAQMKMVAEGVKSVPAVMALAAELDIDMPITHEVHRVLYEGGTPGQAFRGLLRRESGAESDPA